MPLLPFKLDRPCVSPWRWVKAVLTQLHWAQEEVHVRLSLWTSRASAPLLVLLHGSPCVLFTGPETYIAVTILRAVDSVPPPAAASVTLIKPHWLACLGLPCLGQEKRWDVTPATEFGRAPLLALVPPMPTPPQHSSSSATSPKMRRPSSSASSIRPPRSPKISRKAIAPASLSPETVDPTTSSRGSSADNPLTHTPSTRVHPRTSFPPEQLALYESQSRQFARRWSSGHHPEVVPIATHLVRIPAAAGDGYFYLDFHSCGETVTTRTLRIWSFTLPLGTPSGAPLLLLAPETLLWIVGAATRCTVQVASFIPHLALGLVARILRLVLPRLTGQDVHLPSTKEQPRSAAGMRQAINLAPLGIRQPLLYRLDEQWGRGGVTYWR